MDRQTERELIEKIQETGCVLSYTRLLKELDLYKDVYQFIGRYLPNPSDAEEITQETIFRTFNNIQSFDVQRGRFRPWVFGIAVHQAYDRLNERKHCSIHELEDMPGHQHSPEDVLQLMEMEEALLVAIDALPERYRRILMMYFIQGLTHKEIAECEGITPNNAGTILNRAKDRCIQLYNEQLQSIQKASRFNIQNKARSAETIAFADIFSSLNRRLLQDANNR
jgi:RNA polymerase sigma-70 factor (ECF subfamily)